MTQFDVREEAANVRRVTFKNPPFNVVGADTVAELSRIVDDLSGDDRAKVVIFDSAVPGYFFNHADLSQLGELLTLSSGESTPLFVDLAMRIAAAPFVSIASIRGRTRGGGAELALCFDLRYASRE